MATLESVVLLIVFVVMTSYSIGFFGVIHTAIIGSIASRSLAFETFRNRANVSYWRDNKPSASDFQHYKTKGQRNHGVISDAVEGQAGADSTYFATSRDIAYVRNPDTRILESDAQKGLPLNALETQEAAPVLIKTKYGICLNSACGD